LFKLTKVEKILITETKGNCFGALNTGPKGIYIFSTAESVDSIMIDQQDFKLWVLPRPCGQNDL